MTYGIRLRVWGERACFTRPEMKVERVSYDVMTPSAARGILEAILWKPQMRWVVDRIHVLKPIRFQSFRRNEVGAKASTASAERAMKAGSTAGLGLMVEDNRQQRATTLLVNVDYIIEAHFELTSRAGPNDASAKYLSMFNRRAEAGQCFHRPCLGTREFAADFALLAPDATPPASLLPTDPRERDLGWMASATATTFAPGRQRGERAWRVPAPEIEGTCWCQFIERRPLRLTWRAPYRLKIAALVDPAVVSGRACPVLEAGCALRQLG